MELDRPRRQAVAGDRQEGPERAPRRRSSPAGASTSTRRSKIHELEARARASRWRRSRASSGGTTLADTLFKLGWRSAAELARAQSRSSAASPGVGGADGAQRGSSRRAAHIAGRDGGAPQRERGRARGRGSGRAAPEAAEAPASSRRSCAQVDVSDGDQCHGCARADLHRLPTSGAASAGSVRVRVGCRRASRRLAREMVSASWCARNLARRSASRACRARPCLEHGRAPDVLVSRASPRRPWRAGLATALRSASRNGLDAVASARKR